MQPCLFVNLEIAIKKNKSLGTFEIIHLHNCMKYHTVKLVFEYFITKILHSLLNFYLK